MLLLNNLCYFFSILGPKISCLIMRSNYEKQNLLYLNETFAIVKKLNIYCFYSQTTIYKLSFYDL